MEVFINGKWYLVINKSLPKRVNGVPVKDCIDEEKMTIYSGVVKFYGKQLKQRSK